MSIRATTALAAAILLCTGASASAATKRQKPRSIGAAHALMQSSHIPATDVRWVSWSCENRPKRRACGSTSDSGTAAGSSFEPAINSLSS